MSGDMLFGYPVVLMDGPAPGPDDIVLGYLEERRATLRWAMPADGPNLKPGDVVLDRVPVESKGQEVHLRWAMPGGYERVLVLGEAARESLRRGQVPSVLRVWLAESAQLWAGEEGAR